MLQTIRDNSKGVLALGLMFLLFLSFAIWGIDFQFGRPAAPVTVDGEPVALSKINNAYQQQLRSYQQIYPNGIPALQLEELKQSVLRASAQEEAVSRYAEAQGFRVSNQALADWIRQQPGFQLGDAFSFDQFSLQAQQQGMSTDQFEEYIRRALVPEQLRRALVDTAFVTQREKDQRGALEQESRTVSYFTIPAARFLDEVSVSDSDIEAEYQANLGTYKTVEAVKLAYIELNPEEIAADMPVDEAALRKTYDDGVAAGSFVREETRKSRHILIAADGDDPQAQATAQGLLERVRAGEDFAALAAEFSDDPGSKVNGGELDYSPRAAFVGPFSDALFGLEEGEFSEVVKTRFGYHIIELLDVRANEVRPYESVRSELAQDARMVLAMNRVDELSNLLDELVYDNDDSLQPAADETGLPIGQTQWITRTSGQGIGSDATVREIAFSDDVFGDRRNSEAIRYRDGFLYLRIAEHRPARQQTLDEVRGVIESSLKSRAAAQMAAAAGEAARERLSGTGATLAEVAAEYEAEVNESVTLTRRGGGTAPLELVRAAFAAPAPASEGSATLGGADVGDSYAVFAVESVTAGEAMPAALLTRYAQAVGTYEFRGFVEDVYADADVEIRADALQ